MEKRGSMVASRLSSRCVAHYRLLTKLGPPSTGAWKRRGWADLLCDGDAHLIGNGLRSERIQIVDPNRLADGHGCSLAPLETHGSVRAICGCSVASMEANVNRNDAHLFLVVELLACADGDESRALL